MRFKIWEVCILTKTMKWLHFYEKDILNEQGKTVQPLDEIEAMQERLDEAIEEYNLRNELALANNRSFLLTTTEWNILQNSLCISRGLHKKFDIFSDWMSEEIDRLWNRFDHTLNRIIGGYKAQGYEINEEALEKFKSEMINHEPEKAIKTLET